MGGVKVKIQKLKKKVESKAEDLSDDEHDPIANDVNQLMNVDAKGK